MRQSIIVKKIGKTWEGALVSNDRFERTLAGETLEEAALKGLVSLLSQDLPDGTVIAIDVRTETAEEAARVKSLQDATAAEQEASQELAKLEATKVARDKIRAAKEALKNGS